MAIRSGRRFRAVLPHVIILFTFCSYIFLGACGLYFLVFPPAPSPADEESFEDLEDGSGQRPSTGHEQEFIEMDIEILCTDAKKRLEELDRSEFEKTRMQNRERLKKFAFARAVLVCFNWITTIGNRWPGEWEYIESTPAASPPASVVSGSLMSKFYAIAYMLLGIPLTFLTLSNFAALLYDALNAACFGIRRRWHAKMILSKSDAEAQLRRDIDESRLWNPLWFILLLIAYLVIGAALLQHEWAKNGKSVTFAESIWNCAALVFAIGETNQDIFIFPPSAGYCFLQIVYSSLGLIAFGAFVRSFMPLAIRIYQPKAYQIKQRAPATKNKVVRRRPAVLRRAQVSMKRTLSSESPLAPGSIKRTLSRESPLVPPRGKRGPPPAPIRPGASAYTTPRSILRQRNGALSLEPKRDSFESLSSDDMLLPPMVRFAVPTPPEKPPPPPPSIRHQERKPVSEFKIESWSREPVSRPWSSERDLAPKPRPEPNRMKPGSTSQSDSQSSLVYSVSPDSIPFADERISTLIM